MKKMIFIEPKAPGFHIFVRFPLPRIGNFILAALMKRRGWAVEVIIEEQQKIDFELIKSADLIGISTITPTIGRAYAIADKTREMGIPVIMGGPHVTFLPEEALEHADFVVRSEGEHALMALVDALENGKDYSKVPNLSYKSNGKIIHNPVEPFLTNLDELPYPDFSISKGDNYFIAGQRIIPVQTSRGCPFDCSFCSVTGMFGKKYRYRSTENIIEELRQYNKKDYFIFFYDDNFTANRRRARELLQAMIDADFHFHWSTQVRVDVAKDAELVQLMKKAGCHTVFIGFESVNPESLLAMKKNQTVAEIVNAIEVIQGNGIHIHGMFVYGFDEDNWDTVKETVKFAKKVQLTSMQFLILTPFPGSEFYKRMLSEDRIIIKDWSLYDAHHAVFKPKKFSLFDLQRAQIYSHTKVYTFLEMSKKLLNKNLVGLGLAYYARGVNRMWQKKNKSYMKKLNSAGPDRESVEFKDYKQNIVLDEEKASV